MVDDEASPVDAVLAHLTPLQAEVVDLEAQPMPLLCISMRPGQ